MEAKLDRILLRMLDGEPLESETGVEALQGAAQRTHAKLRRLRLSRWKSAWAAMIFGSIFAALLAAMWIGDMGGWRHVRALILFGAFVIWSFGYAVRAFRAARRASRRLEELVRLNEQYRWWSEDA